MQLVDKLRFGTRVGATAATTIGLLGCIESHKAANRIAGWVPNEDVIQLWAPKWAHALVKLWGIDLQLIDMPPQGRYPRNSGGPGHLFIMNHRSGLDIPILLAASESHIVSRHDLAGWPLIGTAARSVQTLFVNRKSKESRGAVLKEMTRRLKEGEGVALFPEGTAFPGDEVRPFHPGSFQIARRTKSTIVPMGLAYDDPAAYYGEESFLDHMQRAMSRPKLNAALVVGEPIEPKSPSSEALAERCREAVQKLVGRARQIIG